MHLEPSLLIRRLEAYTRAFEHDLESWLRQAAVTYHRTRFEDLVAGERQPHDQTDETRALDAWNEALRFVAGGRQESIHSYAEIKSAFSHAEVTSGCRRIPFV